MFSLLSKGLIKSLNHLSQIVRHCSKYLEKLSITSTFSLKTNLSSINYHLWELKKYVLGEC